jgi:hypothetical protein
MGRWSRGNKKRRMYAKKEDGSTSTSTNGGGGGGGGAAYAGSKDVDKHNNVLWSWKQEKEVIAYLTEYRQAAERVYGSGANANAGATDDQNDKIPVVIGGIIFPALTDIAVSQAYMTLSKALSSKQRKKMHELSVDGTYMRNE